MMAAITRRDTDPERRLRRDLWKRGVRGWRTDVAGLPGRPDLAFPKWKVAVFVDGGLWHGHPSKYPANLSQAWVEKIANNVRRDRLVDQMLRTDGWEVIRIWDIEIKRNAKEASSRVEAALLEKGFRPSDR